MRFFSRLLNLCQTNSESELRIESNVKASDLIALQILVKIACDQTLSTMIEQGTIELAFNILHSSIRGPQYKILAIHLLATLCGHPASYPPIVNRCGGTGLERICSLACSPNEEVGVYAAVAIERLAGHCATHTLTPHGIFSLSALLKRKTAEPVLAGLAALAALEASGPAAAEALGCNSACLRRVLRLAAGGGAAAAEGRVVEAALRLVGALARRPKNRPRVISEGGVPVLMAAAAADPGGPSEARRLAAEALTELALLVKGGRRRDEAAHRAADRLARAAAGLGAAGSAAAAARAGSNAGSDAGSIPGTGL